jgi:hypothetical protein
MIPGASGDYKTPDRTAGEHKFNIQERFAMWDLFAAFVLIGTGVILAFFQLRRWWITKRRIHLLVILAAILSELSVMIGFREALIMLVFTVVLGMAAEGGKKQ